MKTVVMNNVVMNNSEIHVNDSYFQHLSATSKNQQLKTACTLHKVTFHMLVMQFTSTLSTHGMR